MIEAGESACADFNVANRPRSRLIDDDVGGSGDRQVGLRRNEGRPIRITCSRVRRARDIARIVANRIERCWMIRRPRPGEARVAGNEYRPPGDRNIEPRIAAHVRLTDKIEAQLRYLRNGKALEAVGTSEEYAGIRARLGCGRYGQCSNVVLDAAHSAVTGKALQFEACRM